MAMVRVALAAFAALAASLPTALNAQVAPPPPIEIVTSETLEQRLVYKAQCGSKMASIDLQGQEGVRLTFDTTGQLALLTVCIDRFQIAYPGEVDSIGEALSLLAYRDAEPLWEAAEAKWGNDLSKLRADLREVAEQSPSSTLYGRLTVGQTDNVRARAFRLADLGYYDDANAILDSEIERLFSPRLMRWKRLDFERVLSGTGRASVISKRGDHAAAAAFLKEFQTRIPDTHEHQTNLVINLAAYLAESGQYAEARDLLEPVYLEFRQFQGDAERYKIGGSDREFSWILACAYHGLGDDEAASPYRDVVNLAEENPRDEYLPQVKRSSVIQLRMAACMNDQDAYLQTAFNGSMAPFSGIWAAMQSPDHSLALYYREDWQLPEDAQSTYLATYRILPERYGPALRLWEGEE